MGNFHGYLKDWLPGGHVQGSEYIVKNPTRADGKSGSFSINVKSGVWSDFATGDKGGDPVSLYAYLNNLKQGEAAKKLAENLGLAAPRISKKKEQQKDKGTPIVPIPDEALEKTIPVHYELGEPKDIYIYTTPEGGKYFINCRFYKDGRKEDRPLTYRGYKNKPDAWAYLSVDKPRPLYNLYYFAQNPQKPVLICEGEKAANAATKLFPSYVCTTSPNGAGNARHSDWSSCKNRDVVIWPDNDEEGRDYAENVAKLLQHEGANSVRIVKVPEDFPEKWDVADPLPEGHTLEELQTLIDNAETPRDPYEVLIEEAKVNPAAPFKPENLELIAELQSQDEYAFEKFRHGLKSETDVRISQLDKALKKNGSVNNDNQKQVDTLLMIARKSTFFYGPDKRVYAEISVDNHHETWPVRSTAFKSWLTQKFFKITETAPNSESMNAALNAICAMAIFEGHQEDVYIRTASVDDRLYVDLCNDEWAVVEIDKEGWRVLKESPVRFIRSPGMLALPQPLPLGDINALRPLLNITGEDMFVLTVAWLLGALCHSSQYPILVILGPYGSAKSSFCEFMRKIVDPNVSLLRTLPKDERDLYISAVNSYTLAFDNISKITNSMSDALCRMATGGGFSTRTLYTDDEEKIFTATRPVILNGIEDIVTRSDLADRCLTITLDRIPETGRLLKKEVESRFHAALPDILGALFTAMSHGLKNLPNVQHENLPRMADFARWATACEGAFWPKGTFMKAYNANRRLAMDIALENCAVARAIMDLMDSRTVWTGSASEFLEHFKEYPEHTTQSDWPRNPEGVAGAIRRMSIALEAQGIKVETGGRETTRQRKRYMTITKIAQWGG